MAYYLLKFISAIFCILPRGAAYALGRALGRFALFFVPSWRMKMAVANIKDCLGFDDEKAMEVAKESVVKFGRMAAEVLRFPLMDEKNVDDFVTTEGLEYIEEAYQKGKGVIMCTAHFGNWELLGADVGLHGYPILSIARKQNDSSVDSFINEYREKVGQKIAYNRGKEGVLAMGRYLKEKHLLGILFDQDTNDTGVEAPIFGKKCITPAGPAVFSRTFGSAILPIFMHYDADGSSRAKIYPPLYCERTKDKDADLRSVTEKLIQILENEIRSNPPMWFWVHDRWKDGRQRFDPEYFEKKRKRHEERVKRKLREQQLKEQQEKAAQEKKN